MAVIFPEGTQNLPAGVIQIQQGVKSNANSYSGGMTTIGLSVSITPKSSSSKILLLANIVMGTNGTTVAWYFRRNSSKIGSGNGAGSRTTLTSKGNTYTTSWNDSISGFYLDSPGTTSAISYDVVTGSHDGRAWYVNRNGGDGDASALDEARSISTITAIEVLAV